MKMMCRRVLLVTFTLLALSSAVFAQGVKWRDGLLSLDGKPYLTYEVTKASGTKIYSYHALGEEETLFQAHNCLNWSYRATDDYRHYYFPTEHLEMILPNKRRYRFKLILPLMVEEGVLDEDGNMDTDALRDFVRKYHAPLPRWFGAKVHQLPVINSETGKDHAWEYSKDYDPGTGEWNR